MLPMHMLYILLALQCGESKVAHDVLADLVDEYEDIDWLLQDATRWNDFCRRSFRGYYVYGRPSEQYRF